MSWKPVTLLLIALTWVISSCDSWVEDVDPPNNVINDDALTTESQVRFLINGVEGRFALTYSAIGLVAQAHSDVFTVDPRNILNVNFNLIRQYDRADFQLSNRQNDIRYESVNELRFLADDLLSRTQDIKFEDRELERDARFAAHFYGGIARYFLAIYFGRSEMEGGGVITTDVAKPGPFIPSDELYVLALERLQQASELASPDQIRTINTLMARIHLFRGEFSLAQASGQDGLAAGDPPFLALNGGEGGNSFSVFAGPAGFYAFTLDTTFFALVENDPEEAARIPWVEVTNPGTTRPVFYGQDLFRAIEAPTPFVTWQENALILAEADLRNGNITGALTHVNVVRESYGLDPLASMDLVTLELERKKELWPLGIRVADQRRFDSWHLGPGTWQYFPIPESERLVNPNL